jgi:cold shock CspA family protein
MRGTMIYFNEEKDVGFIRTEDGARVQVVRGDFVGHAPVGRCSGLEVEFLLTESDEPEAVEVSLIEEDAPRRARRRSSRR